MSGGGAPTWGWRVRDTLYVNGGEAGLLIYDIPSMSLLGLLPAGGRRPTGSPSRTITGWRSSPTAKRGWGWQAWVTR